LPTWLRAFSLPENCARRLLLTIGKKQYLDES
jgi:hypothetical protein